MQLTWLPDGCTVTWDDSTYQEYGAYSCLIDNGKQSKEHQVLGIAQMPLENKVNIQGRGPDDAITREQLALMLYRYAQSMKLATGTGASLAAFGDEAAISDWARQAMSWAVGAGIMSGTPEKMLNPGGTATRAEAAVMVSQFVAWMLSA